MKILFKYTTRSRRSNFLRGIDSIISNLNNKDDYHIFTSIDTDDDKMHPLPKIEGNHTYIAGLSKGKIDAINRDMEYINSQYDWDILINMSDDMVFVEKGFDDIIRRDFSVEKFKEGFNQLDQYFHYNDGNQKSNVCTMHIVGRDYYNRFMYIYHPDYISLWCDVENDMVAKQLGCYKYMGDNRVIFKHLHPAWGFGVHDEQYKKTESREMWEKDEAVFNKHKLNNFGLLTK
jgi:hypothetical protein